MDLGLAVERERTPAGARVGVDGRETENGDKGGGGRIVEKDEIENEGGAKGGGSEFCIFFSLP